MKKLVLLLVLIASLVPVAALANPNRLHGSWKLVALKDGAERKPLPEDVAVVLTFDKDDGTWRAVINAKGNTQQASGTWSMDRNVLTMEYQGRKSSMIATPGGDTLTLGMTEHPSRRFVAIRTAAP